MSRQPTLLVSEEDAPRIFEKIDREVFEAAYELRLASSAEADFALRLKDDVWQLVMLGHPEWKPLSLDYTRGPGAERVRKAWLSRELLKDALSFRKGERLQVVDATAGLLGDTMLLGAWGHRVIAFEQNPVLCFLGLEALRHFAVKGQNFDIELHCLPFASEAASLVLQNRVEHRYDRIYLDPLYPARPKDALNSKELRIVAEVGRGQVQPELSVMIDAAISLGPSRVVVKRPQWEAVLSHPKYQVTSCLGRSTRFDVIHTSR